jgi:hypothetical protein
VQHDRVRSAVGEFRHQAVEISAMAERPGADRVVERHQEQTGGIVPIQMSKPQSPGERIIDLHDGHLDFVVAANNAER